MRSPQAVIPHRRCHFVAHSLARSFARINFTLIGRISLMIGPRCAGSALRNIDAEVVGNLLGPVAYVTTDDRRRERREAARKRFALQRQLESPLDPL